MLTLHRGPYRLIANITTELEKAQIPSIVNSQPFPMASIRGAPTIDPVHDMIFRIKLFNATPEEDFRGINSVNMVVTIASTS